MNTESPGSKTCKKMLEATEAALREAQTAQARIQSHMERYFLVAQDLVCIAGFDGNFKELNPQWEHVLGWTPDELLAKPFIEFVHPEDRKATLREVERQANGEVVIAFENRYRCRDGTYRWLRWYSAADNGLKLIFASARDITERREVEQTIRRLNETLEQRVAERTVQLEAAHDKLRKQHFLIDAIHRAQTKFMALAKPAEIFEGLLFNLIMLSDSEFGFIDEMFHTPEGYPYLVARAITDISWNEQTKTMHADFLAGNLKFTKLKSLFGEVMITGKPVIANDPAHDPRHGGSPPGHPALKSFAGLPLYSNQNFVGVVGLANRPGGYDESVIEYLQPMLAACAQFIAAWRNDQKRHEAEEEVRRINGDLEQRVRYRTAQLEASTKEFEDFCHALAHDLRTPLRAIHGFSAMLLADHAHQLDHEGRRKLDVVCNQTRQMGQMIDDLLAFSRVGRQRVRICEINMEVLARRAFTELTARAPGRNLQLKCESLPAAHGDPELMRQVFVNLLSNAIKFTLNRDLGVIEIGSRQEEQQTVYYVKDNGVGFEMDYKDQLFKVFHRLHSLEEFEGTGAGLALVQRIIQRHGGHVWAEGKVGEGATFYFSLPHIATPAA